MFGGIGGSLQDLHLAFSAGGTPSTGGIDMNPCLHGCLEKIDLRINEDLSTAWMKCNGVFGHDLS